jgi:signal peptidase II
MSITMSTTEFKPRMLPWLGVATIVLLLDQLSKTVISGRFALGEAERITSFFNLVRVHNNGAAFSFLAGASGWQRWFFIGLGVFAVVFIMSLLKKHSGQRLFSSGLALILGGAVGNVVDRILHGHVVDFIQIHWGGAFFPSFNLADSGITVGAVCLLLDEWLRVRRAG